MHCRARVGLGAMKSCVLVFVCLFLCLFVCTVIILIKLKQFVCTFVVFVVFLLSQLLHRYIFFLCLRTCKAKNFKATV
jgi:hypothetical protein